VESTPPAEAAGCVRRRRLSRVVIAAVFLAIIVADVVISFALSCSSPTTQQHA